MGITFVSPIYCNNFEFKTVLHHMKKQSKLDSVKKSKGIHREIIKEMGLLQVHTNKVFKDKSKYSRKSKHKKGFDDKKSESLSFLSKAA